VAQAPAVAAQPPASELVAPTPASEKPTTILVAGGPAALEYVDALDQLFVADRSGLLWRLPHGELTLTRPFVLPGEPASVAADATTQHLFVAIRAQPAVVVLDSNTGQELAHTALPASPADIRLDPSLGLLYVVLPDRDELQVLDVRTLNTVRIIPELLSLTGMALDLERHTLYLSHIDGRISVIDGADGRVTSQFSVSGPGLTGLTIGNGQLVAVNEPEQLLLQVDLSSTEVRQTPLGVEPAAVAVGAQSGSIYVCGVDVNAILKLDAGDASELARAPLGDANPAVASDLSPQTAWLRPRIVTGPRDERLYVIEPEASTLAVLSSEL
jgi:DNA-binding beta-propeller fold protein YncE